MKKQLQKFLFFSSLFILTPSFAQNAGDLFTDFGTNGKVNTNIGQADFIVKSQAIQSDGKIVMVGNVENNSTFECFILRLNPDGSLDTSFNTSGRIIFSEMETSAKILIQNDGKIIVGGTTNFDVVLMRYNTNGTLDTSFGVDGIVSNSSETTSRSLQDFVIQADGKFLVLSDFNSGSQDYRVLRYNSNGTPDTAFGNNGSLTTDIGNVEFSKQILLQSDGKFIVGGTTFSSTNSSTSVFLARYNANGTLDTNFNTNGKKVFSYSGLNEFYNVDVQTDGKIVFVFSSYESSIPKLTVIKLNSNSTFDTTFGTNGISKITVPNNFGNGSKKFRIQNDGKFFILSATYQMVNNSSNNNLLLVRLNANATFDTTFNSSGFQEFSFFANGDVGGDFSFIGNQVLVSGNTEESLVLNKIGLAKFNTTGSLDLSFDGNGKALYFFPYAAYDESNCSAIQTDGKIIMAGTSHINQNNILTACRYNPDGSIDTSFAENGFFKLNTRIYDGIKSMKIDSNGKILIAINNSATVIRLNSNGTFDGSFGTGGFATITGGFSFLNDLKVLADNSILVVGSIVSTVNNVSSYNFMLAKLNSNGTLASDFGSNGITILSATPNYDQLNLIETQADGKIIAAGQFLNTTADNYDIVIFRTNSNGSLDTTFNTTGIFTIGIPNSNDVPSGLQIQNDGKILLADNYNDFENTLLLRINPNGTVDTTFDSDGIIYFNANQFSSVSAVKVLENQQILVAGTKVNATSDFSLIKLNTNGNVDTTFGTSGLVTTDFYNDYDLPSGLLISNNNSIIVTGSVISPTGYADFAMAKYYLNTQLSIGENTKNKKVLFYPNPVQNILNLSPEVETATLFTLDGKQINSKILNNSLTLENLPKGVYFIQMKLSNGEIISDKLVKE